MLQRDYFIRILQEFAAALALFLEKKKDDKDDDLRELYRQYVGDYELLRNCSVEELLTYASEQWNDEERTDRIGMVAELLYAEALLKTPVLRRMLMEKAYRLFDYVEENGSTFSIERQQKMVALRAELAQIGL